MNGKLSRRIRKLQHLYDYTNPMYSEMKHIVHKMSKTKRNQFTQEVDALIKKHTLN